MPLLPGARLGPFEILAPLGAGGMGEVYKARDTRLDRIVAVKVLPTELAADPEFRARFDREARTISQLAHPHICTMHDVGVHEGVPYLVMELLDGETLADRLAAGSIGKPALTLPESLDVATQIADALAAAHRKGIVHRDLKPGNVFLMRRRGSPGTLAAKLLDFGLAKATAHTRGDVSPATTSAHPITSHGTILGTVQYMAPEQLEGAEADERSDIFSFGCLLYEMLTAKKAFEGQTQASLIAAILEREPPPLATLQPLAPPMLDSIVRKCLAKNPDDRWQSAADLTTALHWTSHGSQLTPVASLPAAPRRWLLPVSFAAAVALVVGGALFGAWFSRAPVAPPEMVQFDVLPPMDSTLSPAPVASAPQITLSPDGRQLAFVAAKRRGPSQIYVRSIDGRESRALADTDGASFPFWSADGRHIAFFAGRKLKKIAIAGGPADVLCDAPAGRGGSWNADNVIIFSGTPNTGLQQISASGGQPSVVTTVRREEMSSAKDTDERAIGHNWAYFLPDGRHFLYYERAANPAFQGIYVGELGTTWRSPRVLAINGLAVYGSNHLAYVRDGVLVVQPFDTTNFALKGEPTRVADRVGYFSGSFGYSSIAVSPAGVLAYGPPVATTTALQWVTREGAPSGQLGKHDVYSSPRLSFDQKTVVTAISGQTMAERDVWTLDVARNTASRVTSDPAADWFPAWAPDGDRKFFGSTRTGITSIFQKVGVGQDEVVDRGIPLFATYPNDVSNDGRMLVYTRSTEKAYDLGVMTLDPAVETPFLSTNFNEVQGRFSPNARWIAYASDESGTFEIYVRPYPAADKQWQISATGGMQPEWRRDGAELFYVAADGRMMAVSTSTSGAFEAGVPRALFPVDMPEAAAPFPNHYAVTADGQRFLVNTVVDQPTRPALAVILNWTAALGK